MPSDKTLRSTSITRINSGQIQVQQDLVAIEEPLELRVRGQAIAVVMRTPGHDRELAAGWLLTEGVLHRRDDIVDMVPCRISDGVAEPNVLEILLGENTKVDFARLTRNVFTSSSCGICSKASIEAVQAQFPAIANPVSPGRSVVAALPLLAERSQIGFAASGGLHAAALFHSTGELLVIREDVGRHNALDKVVGHVFLQDRLPLTDSMLLVSGRVSFEIMQKALAAGIPVVAAISAPTSAAIEFAQASRQTLIGFLRTDTLGTPANRMNVYAGAVATDT